MFPRKNLPMKTKPKVVAMTDAVRTRQFKQFVKLCLSVMVSDGLDIKEVSNVTGLSVSTIRRLASGDVSLKMQFRTIQNLAIGAGFVLTLEQSKLMLRVVE